MARYLVIEFLDNDQADAFLKKIDEQTKAGKKYRVVGLFSPPRIFSCKCPITSGTGSALYKNPKPERGEKFGWWLCGTCHKPRPGGHQLNNLLSLGELFGRAPRLKKLKTYEDQIDGRNYEFRVSSLSIFEVPLHNIARKKKRLLGGSKV
jgi:hypothetical protein